MLDKEQLQKDRAKLIEQYTQLEIQKRRIEGAVAYIDDNLKEPAEEEKKC